MLVVLPARDGLSSRIPSEIHEGYSYNLFAGLIKKLRSFLVRAVRIDKQ